MFKESIDDRLSLWYDHRKQIDVSDNPLQMVCDFWHHAPFIPYNKNVDPHFQRNWPTPWEILVENKYDDFTKALMIGWTLKLSKRFQDSKIEVRTLVDSKESREYNVVYINDKWVLNFNDSGPVEATEISEQFRLENLVEVSTPR